MDRNTVERAIKTERDAMRRKKDVRFVEIKLFS